MEVEAENKELCNGYSSDGHNILTSEKSVMVKDFRVAEWKGNRRAKKMFRFKKNWSMHREALRK